MARPSTPPSSTLPAVSLAHLVFGPSPRQPHRAREGSDDWIRAAVHRAVALAGASMTPESEAFLATLYRRGLRAPGMHGRHVDARVKALQSCLPPKIPLADVRGVLVLLDREALRIVAGVLAWALAHIGSRTRAIKAAQRQVQRLNLSPHLTTMFREEAAAALAELARVRTLYAPTHRLLQRLAPPKRDAGITAEAQQLFALFTRTGLSKRRAYRVIATVLQRWHNLPAHTLTEAHIAARLQVRSKPHPVETPRD